MLQNLQEISEIATDRQVSTLSTKDCEKQLYLVREMQRSEQSTVKSSTCTLLRRREIEQENNTVCVPKYSLPSHRFQI